MHCLWLTLADPDPATNGQLIYSKGLIEAARDAGATLRAIGLARRENPRTVCDLLCIDWRLADEQVSRHGAASCRPCRSSPIAAMPRT